MNMSISYRWVIVAAGALMTCVALGAMFSLAIFQEPIALDTGWSHVGIASAMTLNFIVMGIGGFFWGAASDRFGPRVVVMIGAASCSGWRWCSQAAPARFCISN
jgi:MFS family permease